MSRAAWLTKSLVRRALLSNPRLSGRALTQVLRALPKNELKLVPQGWFIMGEDDGVIANGYHPLAGEQLTFAIDVVDVRAATEEELAHGHAH